LIPVSITARCGWHAASLPLVYWLVVNLYRTQIFTAAASLATAWQANVWSARLPRCRICCSDIPVHDHMFNLLESLLAWGR